MEERGKVIKDFARKFFNQAKQEHFNLKLLNRELYNISSYFLPSLKNELSYEDALKNIFEGNLTPTKTISGEWFSLLLGKLECSNAQFFVQDISERFKKDLLSFISIPYTKEDFSLKFDSNFYYMNKQSIQELVDVIAKNACEKKPYSSIHPMLLIKKGLIGPERLIPQIFLSYFTINFSATLIYVNEPENQDVKGIIQISNYFPTQKKLGLFREIEKSKLIMSNFKYDAKKFFNYFRITKILNENLKSKSSRN